MNKNKAKTYDSYPPVLTAEQVAELLQISPTAVYSYAKQGILPNRRFGRSVRFVKKDILELINGEKIDE